VIKPSGSPSHLAIAGEGFFQIKKGQGVYLTRDGAFTFGSDGVLRTNDGTGEVLSAVGEPIKLDPNAPFDVSASNMIAQNGRNIAKVGIVFPSNPGSLKRMGENLLAYDGQDKPGRGQIKQYFLEGSNVDPVREMTDLIEAARGFELNIQMVQLQNDTLGRLVTQVARPG
jgi:flagellar basal body rod protein FlgG